MRITLLSHRVRACLSFLTTALLLSAMAQGADTTSVELILDCSGSMWNKLSDGRYRIDAAKQVLSEFIATAPDVPGLHIGLRLYGSKISYRDPGACQDTALVVPIEGFHRAEMLKIVKTARALGATPLAISLNAAAADFTKEGRKQVIVFTDGEESCDGDLKASLAKLKADNINADVRIIGIGLPQSVALRFAELAPIENTDSVKKLADALHKAIAETVTAAAPAAPVAVKQKVTVKVTQNGGPFSGGAVSLNGITLTSSAPGTWSGEVPPGLYTALVSPVGRSFPNLSVARGESAEFTLDVTVLPKVTVTVSAKEFLALQEIKVSYSGALGISSQYMVIAPADAPESAEPLWTAAPDKAGESTIRLADSPGLYEARFVTHGEDGSAIVCGRSSTFEVKMRKVTIAAPATVTALEKFEVKYQATVLEGDRVGWVKTGAPDGEYGGTYPASAETMTASLMAPGEPGSYEVRYGNEYSTMPFARTAIVVTAGVASIIAPDTAMAGTQINITWNAPASDTVLITIVPKSAGPTEHLEYKYLQDQPKELKFQCGRSPGDMEIRIVSESEGKILARRPIKFTEIKATVKGPSTGAPSTGISVAWTGPGGEGDFVTITKTGAAEDTYLSYVYTFGAEPKLDLTLPEEPGDYELRYTVDGKTVVARQPIKVK